MMWNFNDGNDRSSDDDDDDDDDSNANLAVEQQG